MFPSTHSESAGALSSLLFSRLQIELNTSHSFHLAVELRGVGSDLSFPPDVVWMFSPFGYQTAFEWSHAFE